MKKLIQILSVVVLTMISTSLIAQVTSDTVTVRELNTYETLETEADLATHPLFGETVTFTAVVTSYPKSSGLASPVSTGDEVTSIGRIHIFVTDTSAASMGRDGMSLQIVESNYALIENFNRGDVITVTGTYNYAFAPTAQFDIDEVVLLGNTGSEFPEYASLLEPWKIAASDLNTSNVDGTFQVNLANYSKYNGAYVQIENATVSNVSLGTRPNWAVNSDGSRVYIYDTSLRYRNDRVAYLPSYNFRHGEDGDFIPPAPGSVINLSGYVVLNTDDPDANNAANSNTFTINPYEDGVVWINGTRFEDGDDIGGGTILNWPNDIEVLGAPPLFSEVMLSDSTVTPEDAVTVTANIVGVAGSTVTGAKLFYSGTTSDSLTMTANGDIYSATIPAFPAATSVTFYMIATDSEGLSVRNPLTGDYAYLVEGSITSIAAIQETTTGTAGDSPLAGVTGIMGDITATVTTSALNDGYVTVQDRAAAWSGVFVASSTEIDALAYGDQINITEFSVSEVFGVTTIEITGFEKLETANDMADTMAVTGLVTQDISANFEPYEGVLLTFSDVKVTTNQADGGNDFGEWEFGSAQGGGEADSLEAGEGLRFDDRSSRFDSDVNEHIKIGAQIESLTGVLYHSFGNAKMISGGSGEGSNIITADLTFPNSGFDLEFPANNASVVVTAAITPNWEETIDYDENEVTYEWVLYSADTSEVIVKVPSDNEGADAEVTLSFETVDGLLASAGLGVGDKADFVWNVLVSDGVDTVAVSSGYDIATNTFTPLYYSLNLERGLLTNNEVDSRIPESFGLDQNYPNPFNPATNINFSLPQASKVTLSVYDMLGRRVATLLDGQQLNAAKHSISFDASALASGMYIYRIEAGAFISTRKMMLIK